MRRTVTHYAERQHGNRYGNRGYDSSTACGRDSTLVDITAHKEYVSCQRCKKAIASR